MPAVRILAPIISLALVVALGAYSLGYRIERVDGQDYLTQLQGSLLQKHR